MNQEIEVRKDQNPVVMKSGLIHWVSIETANRIQEALGLQNGHSFIKITELGITINSAQIEGVYTFDQYEDLVKAKQGMWQCEYRKWHGKKEECQCRADLWRKHREAVETKENSHVHVELSAEDKEKIRQIGADTIKMLKGEEGQTDPDIVRTCAKCSKKLTSNLKYYCSGLCLNRAKEDGTYGREQELQEASETI